MTLRAPVTSRPWARPSRDSRKCRGENSALYGVRVGSWAHTLRATYNRAVQDADVVIIGAGTAGASAAMHCARAGLKVVCLDRRDLADSGARWVNDVASDLLEEHGLPDVGRDHLYGHPAPFHMLAGWGPTGVTIRSNDVVALDMRALVGLLHDEARKAGATLLEHTTVREIEDGDRPVVRTNGESYRTRYLLDASGLAGQRLLPTDPVRPTDLCAAAQAVYDVTDHAAAVAFFEEHRAAPGETLAFLGLSGGYSVINVRLREDCVAILTGSIPALGHRSGAQMLDEFVSGRSWIGKRRFGGSRAIPLVLPRKPFASRSRALLGDAAGHVFPAHGSGISAGMAAGRMCADAIVARGDLRTYERAWRKRYESLFRGYDLLRRVSQTLTTDELAALMRSGLFNEEALRAGLEQRPQPLGAQAMLRNVTALRHVPWIIPRVARALRAA